MPADRTVGWDGFHNARDLGDLPTRDGRRTRPGTFYRSAMLELVTDRGSTMVRYLRDAGVDDGDIAALRRRMLG